MSIFRSVIGDPFNFSSVALSGVNYLLTIDDDETEFMALLVSDGIRLSTDKGATWGSTIGVAQGGPFRVGFRQPRTVGSAPAGRIWLTPAVSPTSTIYYTDDNGTTVSSIALPSSQPNALGINFAQADAPGNKIGYVSHDIGGSGTGHIFVFDGTSWSETTNGDIEFGNAVVRKNNGHIYMHGFDSAAETQTNRVRSIDGFDSFISDGTVGPVLTGPIESTLRADYHRGDDVIGLASVRSAGTIDFVSVNASDTYVLQATFASGISDIVAVAAIQGITGKWAISVRTTSSKSQLWVSDDGDLTTWTMELEFDQATAGEGILTILRQYAV